MDASTTFKNFTGKYGGIRSGSNCNVFCRKEQSLMRKLHFFAIVRATRTQAGS